MQAGPARSDRSVVVAVPGSSTPDNIAAVGTPGERGAGLVEYALLVALIVLACVGAVKLFGGATAAQFSSVANLWPQ
jgi:Flp pilus assembly pilin Flp